MGEEFVLIGAADAEQGMAEHGGRAVVVGRREYQYCRTGVYGLESFIQFATDRIRQHGRINFQLALQPGETGRKAAARMLIPLPGGIEHAMDGGFKLCGRVGFASGGKKKARIVDDTLPAVSLEAIVEQDVPVPLPAQVQLASLLSQLLLVVGGSSRQGKA